MEIIDDGIKKALTVDDHKYLDPRTLSEEDYPIIALADDVRSFIGWGIRAHTNGNYNHAIILNRPGMCVSQDMGGFKEKSIEKYLIDGMMLKFWTIRDLTADEKISIMRAINQRLALPWWKRGYDFLGTFVGQLINVKWLQNPFAEFCSEEVNDDFILPVKRTAIMSIKEPSPSELNDYFVKNPHIMQCLGYWWND